MSLSIRNKFIKKTGKSQAFLSFISNFNFEKCRGKHSAPEKRRHAARKILIEKVKKEPDTELLIPPALKEKILLKEGMDLKQINNEYQEKKGYSKGNGTNSGGILSRQLPRILEYIGTL